MTIDEANARFGIVGVGNKVVVMENNPDGSIKELWTFDEFRKLLIKEFSKVKKMKDGLPVLDKTGNEVFEMKPFAEVWLRSKKGRQYNQLVYKMPGSQVEITDQDYNGWLGFTVKPVQGDWSKNRDHIFTIICDGKEDRFNWLMNWTAALIQEPGRHGMVAPVFRGGFGIGKGHFVNRMIGALFNKQQYLHVNGAQQLTGQFNEHLSGKCFVFADEATWGGDPKAADRLKALITESNVMIERKFLKQCEEPSALHVAIASNNDFPVLIGPNDRRFSIFDVSSSRAQDDGYFKDLIEELKNGGLAAMLYDLLEYEVDWPMTRRPIMTEAKQEIVEKSLKPVERWWFEKLKTGSIYDDGRWDRKVDKKTLHDDYIRFLDTHDKRGSRELRSTQTEVGVFLRRQGATNHQMILTDGTRPRVWDFNDLATCRAKWLENLGLRDFQWDKND